MRFAARESAIFGQPEQAFGTIPGGGGVQHLARLMGRARALEVMLSAEDYDAELAERYGWINRALPASALDHFVRIARASDRQVSGRRPCAVKDRVNAIALAPVEDFRRDSRSLRARACATPKRKVASSAAMERGFQTRDAEMLALGPLTWRSEERPMTSAVSMKKAAYLAFALLGVIWGSNFIFMKWAAEDISPSQIVLLRVVFGFLPIFLFALAKRALRWEHIRYAHHFVVMSLLATAVYYFAFAKGTALLPSSIAGLLSGAIPLFTFICAWLFLSEEHINLTKAAGVALGFLGVLLIARPWSSSARSTFSASPTCSPAR